MTLPADDPRMVLAQELLQPHGDAISPPALARLLSYKRTQPVIDRIEAKEFPAIELGHGRYSIPTRTLVPWLASRLSIPEETR